MARTSRVALALAGAVLWAAPASARSFALHDGDRVVFYGDSITEQHVYSDFVESYVRTRFPDMRVEFVDAGWSGDWVVGGGGGKAEVRLARDVVARRPTVVVAMFGMNDAGYRAFDQSYLDVYAKGYRHVVDTLRAKLPGLRITLLRPSPFDDFTAESEYRPVAPKIPGGYNPALVRFGEFVAELGRERGLTVVDTNAPVVGVLRRAAAEQPDKAGAFLPDRIHPGPPAGLLVAAAVLEAWNAPAVVTEVEIDALGGRVTTATNTAVSGLAAKGSVSWTQRDRALPFPLDTKNESLMLAARLGDVGERLDSQPLRVTGLSAMSYALSIDGAAVGTFSRDELDRGVDLATLATPMLAQSTKVHELTAEHNGVHVFRWQHVQVGLEGLAPVEGRRAGAALDALERRVVARAVAAAWPRPRRYVLTPVSAEGQAKP